MILILNGKLPKLIISVWITVFLTIVFTVLLITINATTKDLLNTINVISGTNYSSVITTNIGEMDNKGVEFAINAVPVHTKNWKWTVGMNYTWNDSEITKLNVIDSDANFVQTGAISGTGKTVQVFMVRITSPYFLSGKTGL